MADAADLSSRSPVEETQTYIGQHSELNLQSGCPAVWRQKNQPFISASPARSGQFDQAGGSTRRGEAARTSPSSWPGERSSAAEAQHRPRRRARELATAS
jgi:hypothetical protein